VNEYSREKGNFTEKEGRKAKEGQLLEQGGCAAGANVEWDLLARGKGKGCQQNVT